MGKYEAKNTNGHWITNPKLRAYLYGVIASASPIAIYYGFVTESEAGLWISFGGVLLGVSNTLALRNTGNGADNDTNK